MKYQVLHLFILGRSSATAFNTMCVAHFPLQIDICD